MLLFCHGQDLENTTGSWDMYGQDSDKRYPSMQAEFFTRSGDILRRREALRGFVALCACTAAAHARAPEQTLPAVTPAAARHASFTPVLTPPICPTSPSCSRHRRHRHLWPKRRPRSLPAHHP